MAFADAHVMNVVKPDVAGNFICWIINERLEQGNVMFETSLKDIWTGSAIKKHCHLHLEPGGISYTPQVSLNTEKGP